jgi:major membrane immunogen (membrane-anchored lipoprotein)
MKYLLTGVAAITMLTACGQKDKPDDAAAPSGIVFSESKVPSYLGP